MALAYPIRNVKDLAHAFAAKDEFISALSYYLYSNTDNYIMNPLDEYYVAPYCFMCTKNNPKSDKAGFLVFSSMAPFVQKREHDEAFSLIKRQGYHKTPFIGTIEKFQELLKLKEKDIYTFTSDGCVPTAEDVSQELEDVAIRVVCDLMRWRYPYSWRDKREDVASYFGPVLDLAEYDGRKKNKQQQLIQHQDQNHQQLQYQQQEQQQQQEHFYDAKECAADDQKIAEEEKKETTALDYLPLPPVQTPTQDKKSGGFFERNADIFNNPFISRYNHNDLENEEDDDGNTFISTNNTVYDEDDIFHDIYGI